MENHILFSIKTLCFALFLLVSSPSQSQDRSSRNTSSTPETKSVSTIGERTSALKVITEFLELGPFEVFQHPDYLYHLAAPSGASRSGKCWLFYAIDEKGEVTSISVSKCTERFFVQPAVEAISVRRYESGNPSKPPYLDHNMYVIFDHIGDDGNYVPALGDKSDAELAEKKLRAENLMAFNKCQTPEYLVEKAKVNFQIKESLGLMYAYEEIDEVTREAMENFNNKRKSYFRNIGSENIIGRDRFRDNYNEMKDKEQEARKNKYYERAMNARKNGYSIEPETIKVRSCEEAKEEIVNNRIVSWNQRKFDEIFGGFVTSRIGEEPASAMSESDKAVFEDLISAKTRKVKRVFENSPTKCTKTTSSVGIYIRTEVGSSTSCSVQHWEGFKKELNANSKQNLDKNRFLETCSAKGLTPKFCGCMASRLNRYVSTEEYDLFFQSPRAFARMIYLQRARDRRVMEVPLEYRGVDDSYFKKDNWLQDPSARYQSVLLDDYLAENLSPCLVSFY